MKSWDTSAEKPSRLRIAVRVTPRAGRDEITRDGKTLRVKLTAPPVDGAANEALVSLLAARLHLAKRAIEIVRGVSSREKLIEITGLSETGFWSRLGF